MHFAPESYSGNLRQICGYCLFPIFRFDDLQASGGGRSVEGGFLSQFLECGLVWGRCWIYVKVEITSKPKRPSALLREQKTGEEEKNRKKRAQNEIPTSKCHFAAFLPPPPVQTKTKWFKQSEPLHNAFWVIEWQTNGQTICFSGRRGRGGEEAHPFCFRTSYR
ncbi:hypothetical protein NPIL_440301 [Nephila pilipes]|uniref:Uncharacterized protein n=1 Tax=Nephila pilipes TaxID=299642 RepID=A0A8X6NGB4_NEPPI|nr:hypothetical protein NPIL_440301 [Nephila pilipes]